jgi:DNA-binding GntR family transcriptional regulator
MKQLDEMPERDVEEHSAIVDAIAARQPAAAREAMVRHIRGFAGLTREAAQKSRAPVRRGKRTR